VDVFGSHNGIIKNSKKIHTKHHGSTDNFTNERCLIPSALKQHEHLFIHPAALASGKLLTQLHTKNCNEIFISSFGTATQYFVPFD
jgi:hypothetical protein